MNLHDIPDTTPVIEDPAERLAATEPLSQEEVDDLVADYLKNGSIAISRTGPERILATIIASQKEVPA